MPLNFFHCDKFFKHSLKMIKCHQYHQLDNQCNWYDGRRPQRQFFLHIGGDISKCGGNSVDTFGQCHFSKQLEFYFGRSYSLLISVFLFLIWMRCWVPICTQPVCVGGTTCPTNFILLCVMHIQLDNKYYHTFALDPVQFSSQAAVFTRKYLQ